MLSNGGATYQNSIIPTMHSILGLNFEKLQSRK